MIWFLCFVLKSPDLSENQFSESVRNRKKVEFDISIKGIRSVMSCCIKRIGQIHNSLVKLESKVSLSWMILKQEADLILNKDFH